jgi:hypothetical protein
MINRLWPENCNSNITTQLACYSPEQFGYAHCNNLAKDIFKIFEDFRLVQQIRKEIEKVKPTVASVSPF